MNWACPCLRKSGSLGECLAVALDLSLSFLLSLLLFWFVEAGVCMIVGFANAGHRCRLSLQELAMSLV